MKERGRRLSISFGRFLIIIIFYFTDFLSANIAFVYFLFIIIYFFNKRVRRRCSRSFSTKLSFLSLFPEKNEKSRVCYSPNCLHLRHIRSEVKHYRASTSKVLQFQFHQGKALFYFFYIF